MFACKELIVSQYASLFTGEESNNDPPQSEGPAAYQVILVDDEPNILSALKRVF